MAYDGAPWRMGAGQLAAAVRARAISAREVVEAHLARIAEVNPRVNAVTVTLADDAIAAADAADRALAAGGDAGPLLGVPMTVKENIDVAGSATTNGLVVLKDAVPATDAPHIAKLKGAGAIVIGRTNMPDVGLRFHTDNALRGATLNPWDAARTPGGSSGGDAAALACGMSALGMGNDYGGSLRWPAQACGVMSLRPTLGRVPRFAAIPPEDGTMTAQLFSVHGPMARRADDLATAFAIMTAADARDPWWTPAQLEGPPLDAPVRVAVCADPAGEGVDPDVAAGVRRAAGALADAGYAVEEVDFPMVAEARDLYSTLVVTELRAVTYPLLEPLASDGAKAFLQLAFETVPALDLAGYVQAWETRNSIARAWSVFAERYPLALGPVGTQQPFPAGFDIAGRAEFGAGMKLLRLTVTVNLLGLPSVAMPAGLAGGLPQGVQIIGRRYREDTCLAAARAIEERLPPVAPIDPR